MRGWHAPLVCCFMLATQIGCRPTPRACDVAAHRKPCPVEPGDTECFVCLKQSCCPEGNLCFIPGTPCFCQFACTMRHEPHCEETCGKPDSRFEAMNACKAEHCAAACTL